MARFLVTAAVAVSTLLFGSTPGNAAKPITGNDWLNECSSSDEGLKLGCVAYVLGIGDALFVWEHISFKTAIACIPDSYNGGQLLDVGVRFIKEHAKDRHRAAGILLTEAFAEAWPCNQKGD
jgi:hypothetical protein